MELDGVHEESDLLSPVVSFGLKNLRLVERLLISCSLCMSEDISSVIVEDDRQGAPVFGRQPLVWAMGVQLGFHSGVSWVYCIAN